MTTRLGEIKRAKEIGRQYTNGNIKYIWAACVDCGKERWVRLKCGQPVYTLCKICGQKEERHSKWQGGVFEAHGYIFVRYPNHPRANKRGYIKRAVLVLEKKLGRFLKDGMDSHHKNGFKDDDRPENLEEKVRGKHRSDHMIEYWKQRKTDAKSYAGIDSGCPEASEFLGGEASSCFNCPFPKCIYDKPRQGRKRNTERDAVIKELSKGMSIKELAVMFNLSKRRIQGILGSK